MRKADGPSWIFQGTDDNGNLRIRNYYDSTTNFSLTREIGKLPHLLFIVNDNHTFNELKKEGRYKNLILSFFKSKNIEQAQMIIKNDFSKYLWKE